jgi:hypothetical protein
MHGANDHDTNMYGGNNELMDLHVLEFWLHVLTDVWRHTDAYTISFTCLQYCDLGWNPLSYSLYIRA